LRDSASFEPLSVTIRPGISFSTLVREVSHEWIFTKFGTNIAVVDVINPDKMYVNLFKGFDFTGSQKFPFSHRKLTSPL